MAIQMNNPTRKFSCIQLGWHERGIAALAVILVLLFSISGITLYAANTGVLEQKVSINDYRGTQLAETADAGLDYALSWLSLYQPSWSPDPANSAFEIDNTSITPTLNTSYILQVELRRAVAEPRKVTITATARDAALPNRMSVSRTTIVQNDAVGGSPNTPLLVNGNVTGVNGNPTLTNNEGGDEIVTSGPVGGSDPGNFKDPSNMPTQNVSITEDAFTGSAWDRVFGIPLSEMQALAALDSDVYWITQNTPWHPPSDPLGSATNPVIVIIKECIQINGNNEIYGIVYFEGPCVGGGGAAGWGGAVIHGSVIFEGDVDGLNANAAVDYDDDYIKPFAKKTRGVKNRIPGSWIDTASD